MRFTSATVAAVCLLSASENLQCCDGFTTRPPLASGRKNTVGPSHSQVESAGRSSLTPLKFTVTSGGIEELQEWSKNQSPSIIEKQVQKSPSFWKLAGYATIPASAAIGFGIVPSRRLAAHAIGAIVTGVAGAIGKSKLDAVTESAALPAIGEIIIEHGVDDPTTTNGYINSLKELHGIVDDDDFAAMCVEIYSKYLLGMVKNDPQPRTSEPKELGNLKIALGLSNLLVGEAHAAASASGSSAAGMCMYVQSKYVHAVERSVRE